MKAPEMMARLSVIEASLRDEICVSVEKHLDMISDELGFTIGGIYVHTIDVTNLSSDSPRYAMSKINIHVNLPPQYDL